VTSPFSHEASLGEEPRPGNVYLVEERRPRVSYDLFDKALGSGFEGLVVTRDFPKKVAAERGLASSRMLWLTNLVGEGRVNPTAIGILMNHLRTFIEGRPKSVIMLDGLEYLVSLNTYDRMLQFMHQLRDIVATNECILVVPVDPRTMSEREVAMFERSMEVVVPRPEMDIGDEPIIGSATGEIRLLDVGPR